MADGGGGGGPDAEAGATDWDALPQVAALCVLHFLNAGHAKTASLVCRAWRDTLHSQARHAALATWGGAGAGAGLGRVAEAPARPLHEIAPNLEVVDVSRLPPDPRGGQLAALIHDLARLTGLTELRLGAGSVLTREVSIAAASTTAVFGRSVSVGLGASLPHEISVLTGLRSLSIAAREHDDVATGDPHVPAAASAMEVPPALSALTALMALSVGGLVLPRRQLHTLGALRCLELAGWNSVTKMVVHLHKLSSLEELSLSPEDGPERHASGQLLSSLLGELTRMRPLKRLRLEWGASQRVPPLEAVPDGALDRALAVHGHSLVSLESDLFRGVRPSSLASLGRLTRLESLKLRGFACMAAEAVITPWPEGVLPAGLSRLTALEVEDICDCGCSADLPWSCEIFPCLEELRMEGCAVLSDALGLDTMACLPDDLAGCPALRSLSLASGELYELPLFLTGLEDLSLVNLPSLEGLEFWLSALTRLTRLECDYPSPDGLDGLHCLNNMTGLRVLQLSDLQLITLVGDAAAAGDSPRQGGRRADLAPGLRVVSLLAPEGEPLHSCVGAEVAEWLASRRFLTEWHSEHCGLGPSLPERLPDGLEALDVSNNRIKRLPGALSRLVDLRHLSVCNNPLKSLPDGITRLHSLAHLDVGNCLIQELPRGMSALVCLERLLASPNPHLRMLPPCLGGAPALREIQLAGTAVTALPPEWATARGGALPALALLALPRAAEGDGVVLELRARNVHVRLGPS